MALLLLFAFIAGAGTALSPCVLPVLPAVLSAGGTGGARRPLGIAIGLGATFTLVIAGLASAVGAAGLGGGALRTIAIVALAAFGAALVVPPLGNLLRRPVEGLARFGPKSTGNGFWSGIGVGGALGFLYAPCAGPILAAVIAVAGTQGSSPEIFAIALAYAAGSALVLFGLALLGRLGVRRFGGSATGARVQRVLGAVLVATAVVMAFQLDIRFQTLIADDLPAAIVNPTGSLERAGAVESALEGIRGESTFDSDRSAPLDRLGMAPDFTGIQEWINSDPISLEDTRGEITLIDFWTYTCINCIRTLPQLTAWDTAYRDTGLNIVGVHTPEFEFEHDPDNVRAAIAQSGIEYPVAIDNDYGTWNAWGNNFWPAKYLIDAEGQVRYTHFGEGEYVETENAIRALLAEAGEDDLPAPTQVAVESASAAELTPETYLGLARAEGFEPNDRRPGLRDRDGVGIDDLPVGGFSLDGPWDLDEESATAGNEGAALLARVSARKVFLVLSPPSGSEGTVEVLLDGRAVEGENAGSDVVDGSVTVDSQRLYRLIDAGAPRELDFELRFSEGTSAFAFTFG